jgi:hypothetical protein
VDYTEENGEKVVRLAVADKVLSIPKKDLVKANLVDETATIAE